VSGHSLKMNFRATSLTSSTSVHMNRKGCILTVSFGIRPQPKDEPSGNITDSSLLCFQGQEAMDLECACEYCSRPSK